MFFRRHSPPVEFFVLPIPIYVPVPIWCEPPAYVVPPPNNVIFVNVHNRVEINNTTNIVKITNRAGQTTTMKGEPPSAPRGAGRANRYGSQRAGDRPGVTAVGRAQGKHNAEQASAWEQHPGASNTTRTAAPPVRKAITGNGWRSRCRQQAARPSSEVRQPISRP